MWIQMRNTIFKVNVSENCCPKFQPINGKNEEKKVLQYLQIRDLPSFNDHTYHYSVLYSTYTCMSTVHTDATG